MIENQRYLKAAQTRAREFETEMEPEWLRESLMAIENVNLAGEPDPKAYFQLRADCLSMWLHLVDLLDRFFDPNFDPKDAPANPVLPPPLPDGVVLRPGADPALIADPKARAEYETAIDANRAKMRNYRMQIELGRLNERIPSRAKAFIRRRYASTTDDLDELRSAIDEAIGDPKRKAELLKLPESRQP